MEVNPFFIKLLLLTLLGWAGYYGYTQLTRSVLVAHKPLLVNMATAVPPPDPCRGSVGQDLCKKAVPKPAEEKLEVTAFSAPTGAPVAKYRPIEAPTGPPLQRDILEEVMKTLAGSGAEPGVASVALSNKFGKRILLSLLQVASDEKMKPMTRYTAMLTAVKIDNDLTLKTIAPLVLHADPAMRTAVALTFGEAKTVPQMKQIVPLLVDPSGLVRQAAVSSILQGTFSHLHHEYLAVVLDARNYEPPWKEKVLGPSIAALNSLDKASPSFTLICRLKDRLKAVPDWLNAKLQYVKNCPK